MPDDLTAAAVAPLLRTHRLGRRFHCRTAVRSTNLSAARLARRGAAAGVTVVADTQTGGRGRDGRAWFSPPGVNLYVSVILRPPKSLRETPQLAPVAGLAAAAAIRQTCAALRPRLKWPNDILLQDRKVAGILCTAAGSRNRTAYVIVGLGINVNLDPAQAPPELARTLTSLRTAAGHDIARNRVLAAVLNELETRYEQWCEQGLEPFRDEWDRLSALRGRAVRVVAGATTIDGIVTGLSPEGALQLRTAAGSVREIKAGDAHIRQK